jgi:hypothetical protein
MVIARIAEFEARLDAVEESGRDREIALRGVEVGGLADVLVRAENLLQDDDGALRGAGGPGQIGADRLAVLAGKGDLLSHDFLSLCFDRPGLAAAPLMIRGGIKNHCGRQRQSLFGDGAGLHFRSIAGPRPLWSAPIPIIQPSSP